MKGTELYHSILKQYWGFDSFRDSQETVIDAVCSGDDVLALFPTGGGKSIVFQVAGLARKGLCIVVSPLIALMKDQVENLLAKGVKALAIYSGMTAGEIQRAYEKCMYANYSFLYISPERLTSKSFLDRAQYLPVSLIAVDEAHCVSQWGYDFRPPYLKIADLRSYYPNVPVLALTATATPEVAIDIQEKLLFKKKQLVKRSFIRPNLTYYTYEREDKLDYLCRLVKRADGCGVVYVRNRKSTKDIAALLQKRGFMADYYHAGLPMAIRNQKQEWWTKTDKSLIVATNAFGMGIDKPDVKFVVHLDLPESLEAYFQEAGRAGRDGNDAYAVLLYSKKDIANLRRQVTTSFPEKDYIKKVYEALGNFLQVPIGSCKGRVFDFNLSDYSKRYKLQPVQAYSALRILEAAGYIVFAESYEQKSKVKFEIGRDDLYRFQLDNLTFEGFLKLLLRTYTGLFTDYVKIDEQYLAKIGNTSVDNVKKYLVALAKVKVLTYLPRKVSPILMYKEERLPIQALRIPKEVYTDRFETKNKKAEEIIRYTIGEEVCRTVELVSYFGEKGAEPCGKCNVCREHVPKDVTSDVVAFLQSVEKIGVKQLAEEINAKEYDAIQAVRQLMGAGQVVMIENTYIALKKQKRN